MPAAEGVQHLRPRRAHPRPLARSHDHDVQHHAAYLFQAVVGGCRLSRDARGVGLFSGCGMALKLGYDQGPSLAFRWLDGYVEFDDAQSLKVRAGLDDSLRLASAHPAARLCRAARPRPGRAAGLGHRGAHVRLGQELRARFDPALQQALPTLADVAPTLSLQQLAHIEKRFAVNNGEYRDEFLHRDPAKRQKAATEREIERAEDFYGRLDEAQRAFVARSIAASPWDGDLAYAERLRRQQDLLAMARRLAASRAAPGRGGGRGPGLDEAPAALAARELPALPGAPRRLQLQLRRQPAQPHQRRAAQEGGEEARGLGGRAARSRRRRRLLSLSPARTRRPGAHWVVVAVVVSTFTRRGLVGPPLGKPWSAAMNIAGSSSIVAALMPSLLARAS